MEAAKELQGAVQDFSHFIKELPVQALTEKACGPREILIHVIFWLENHMAQVKAILADKTPEPPHGHFDDLHEQAVKANQGVSIDALLVRFQSVCDWLCNAAQNHEPDSLVLTLKKGSAYRHPLRVYLSGEAGHIRWHQQILTRQINGAWLSDIEKLRETVDEFCQYIVGLPETTLTEQAWGPKEILAHFVAWHAWYLVQIEAMLAGNLLKQPIQGIKAFNEQAVEAGRGEPVEALLSRFQAANERLCELGQTLDPQEILVRAQYNTHTLDGLISSAETHIRNHHKKLR